MALRSISNRRGFFSDYWLDTLASARGREGARLTPAQARRTLERLRRANEATATARLLLDLRSASTFVPAVWQDLPSLMSSHDLEGDARDSAWWGEFEAVRERERFFHWELEFPEVFAAGGFNCVLGNPPWDKVLPSKHEFYGRHDVLIRAYKGNQLDQRIHELHAEHPGLADEFAAYRGRATMVAQMFRSGGDFPLVEARSQAAHEEVANKTLIDRSCHRR